MRSESSLTQTTKVFLTSAFPDLIRNVGVSGNTTVNRKNNVGNTTNTAGTKRKLRKCPATKLNNIPMFDVTCEFIQEIFLFLLY